MTTPRQPAAAADTPNSALPVVAKPSTGVPLWAVIGGALLAAILLFVVLDARRRAIVAPSVSPRSVDAVAMPAPPPTLYIPPEPAPSAPILPPQAPPAPVLLPLQSVAPMRAEQRPRVQQMPSYAQPPQAQPMPAAARVASGSALMIDTSSPRGENGGTAFTTAQKGGETGSEARLAGARVGAGVLANRALTVPQGTLIPAVLETALDSTLPGLARAIVSSDIRGFDGSRVLIPRGSRLIGEYAANASGGQNRMLVNWLRLLRPDGATIDIGSPAADTLGRGGIRAKVNSHFFERFSGAILQSALDVGVNLASRSANSPVIVALPGTAGSIRQTVTPSQVRPTLKVNPATSISVFVARDLDFTGVEER